MDTVIIVAVAIVGILVLAAVSIIPVHVSTERGLRAYTREEMTRVFIKYDEVRRVNPSYVDPVLEEIRNSPEAKKIMGGDF